MEVRDIFDTLSSKESSLFVWHEAWSLWNEIQEKMYYFNNFTISVPKSNWEDMIYEWYAQRLITLQNQTN